MSPTHHPGEEWLMDYAAGTLPEALSLPLAAHLVYCPLCRADVTCLERAAGAMLDQVDHQAISSKCRQAVLAKLAGAQTGPCSKAEKPKGCLPEPIRPYIGGVYYRLDQLDALLWETIVPGFQRYTFSLSTKSAGGGLVKLAAGNLVHAKAGDDYIEISLVLSGCLTQGTLQYKAGDLFLFRPGEAPDQPLVAAEDSLCLTMVSAV